MLGSTDLSAILGSGVDGRDHDAVKMYLRQCADAGLSVLLCKPGTKEPFDGRTVRKRNAEDKIAREEARTEGRRNWAKAKSPSGLALATSDKTKLTAYLKQYIAVFGDDVCVNIAIEVGSSGVIIIDVDTPAQLRRFYEVCGLDDDDIEEGRVPAPTIVSPGHIGDGDPEDPETWAHHGGGHFWFTVPDKLMPALPRNLGAMTWSGADGFAILWDRRYVLIPPSERPEGGYELVGKDYDVTEAAPWIVDVIVEKAKAKAKRLAQVGDGGEFGEDIVAWGEEISWAEILDPLGWTQTARPDQCGCDVWTAPGVHASPKSATAHDGGCSDGRYDNGGALHIWTDNPGPPFDKWFEERPGSTTLSKLQVIAYADYDGSIGKAMDALGLDVGSGTEMEREAGVDNSAVEAESAVSSSHLDEDLTAEDLALPEGLVDCNVCGATANENNPNFAQDSDGDWWHLGEDGESHLCDGDPPEEPPTDDKFSLAGDDDDDAPEPDVFDCGIQGVPIIAPFSYWRGLPAPQYVIDGLIENNGLSLMIGPSGIGKSTVALDMACHIATGRAYQGRKTLKQKVLYLPGEGLNGAIQRLEAWAQSHAVDAEELSQDVRLGDSIIRLGASKEAWAAVAGYLVRQNVGLIIFDTFARMSLGIEENSATDVGRAIERFDQIRRLTGAGVMVVHHTGKADITKARGSSALQAAVDSELLIGPAQWTFDELGIEGEGERPPEGRPLQLWTSKQKNAEQMEHPMPLLMKNYPAVGAPIITAANGEIDPMLGDVVLARPNPEPVIETAIRLRAHLDKLPKQGASRSELVAAVKPDPYTAGRADAARAWKQKVALAVDLGLYYVLIQTLTGKMTGARYVPGSTTPDEARTLAAKDILTSTEDPSGEGELDG